MFTITEATAPSIAAPDPAALEILQAEPGRQRETIEIASGNHVSPAVTTCGMREDEMRLAAGFLDRVPRSGGDEGVISRVREEVLAVCDQFPLP